MRRSSIMRLWLVLILAFQLTSQLALAQRASTETSRERRPNILLILSDDCGHAEFSIQGHPRYKTPHIDSIGKNGVHFRQGYVSGCVCSPSRAGLLTGRYQQRFGHEFNIPPAYSETNGLPRSETLLPQLLKEDGYRTIALGKWHLGYAPQFHPMERGFTDYYGFLQGSRSYFPLKKPTRLNQMLRDRTAIPEEKFDYMTDHLADEAIAYINKWQSQPWMIYLAFNATHSPNDATAADLKAADGNKIYAMTIALDRAVGKVLDALKECNLSKDTLVIFINDNGGAGGHDNGALHGKKGSTWEGGTRIPFLVQYPAKIPPGQVIDEPVIALDLFPTILEVAGVDDEELKKRQFDRQKLDGISLIPRMTGKTQRLVDRPLYWKSGKRWAIRHGNLKAVAGNEDQGDQAGLFDLFSDPYEQQDLSATHSQQLHQLEALYHQWASTLEKPRWGSSPGKKSGSGSDDRSTDNP